MKISDDWNDNLMLNNSMHQQTRCAQVAQEKRVSRDDYIATWKKPSHGLTVNISLGQLWIFLYVFLCNFIFWNILTSISIIAKMYLCYKLLYWQQTAVWKALWCWGKVTYWSRDRGDGAIMGQIFCSFGYVSTMLLMHFVTL